MIVQEQHNFSEVFIVHVHLDRSLRASIEVDVDEYVEDDGDQLDSRPDHRIRTNQDLILTCKDSEARVVADDSGLVPSDCVLFSLERAREVLTFHLVKHLLQIRLHVHLCPFLIEA